MNALDSINIEVSEPSSGMVKAVINELTDYLTQLVETDQTHSIDINSLPLNSTDLLELKAFLGEGEVNITLNSLGKSQIHETQYSGIWWVSHFNDSGNIIAELIEICHVPKIISSHKDDIENAVQSIKNQIMQ